MRAKDEAGPGVRILLIENVTDIREMYAFHLEHVGFHVESAADGREGLTKAHSLRPDIIVLDLSLPQVDGWTLCKILKQTPLTRRIPVIVLSGFADEKSRELAQAAGVDAFLSGSPCLPEELVVEIQRQLTGSSLSSAPAPTEPKCARCSNVIEGRQPVVFEHGDLFHTRCWRIRESQLLIQQSRRLTKRSKKSIDDSSARLTYEPGD